MCSPVFIPRAVWADEGDTPKGNMGEECGTVRPLTYDPCPSSTDRLQVRTSYPQRAWLDPKACRMFLADRPYSLFQHEQSFLHGSSR